VFNVAVLRDFVEQIAAKELELASDAIVFLGRELEILEHAEVKMDEAFGFVASVSKLSIGKSAGDGQEAVGDTLHRGDDDGDIRGAGGGAYQTGGVQHALGTQQRGAAKFKGDNVSAEGLRVN